MSEKMQLDTVPYDCVSELQFLKNKILCHLNYENLNQDIRLMLEGRHPFWKEKPYKITNAKNWLENVLVFLDRGTPLQPPIIVSIS